MASCGDGGIEDDMNDPNYEHKKLANTVKRVHADLRKQYQNLGESEIAEVWEKHVQNKDVLKRYAEAMYHLAVDHWTKNEDGTRIEWCRCVINEYFTGGGLQKVLDKEKRRKEHFRQHQQERVELPENDADGTEVLDRVCLHGSCNTEQKNTVHLPMEGKIRLLDVGSCYNPFQQFPEFQTLAIDISPATKDVYQCDFLGIMLSEETNHDLETYIKNIQDPVNSLPVESFHCVVFSLLLEYLPAPSQRWMCCKKAYKLLMYNGILVIITPDSHQQHRNAHVMKSWKTAIESIGFKRWRYEKLEHLHCMVFRKACDIDTQTEMVSESDDSIHKMMFIPQDFHHVKEESKPGSNIDDNDNNEIDNDFKECFSSEFAINELPFS